MIWQFLAAVQTALSTPGPLALGAAALWGVLSILLSPCALVLIPLVMGWVQNDDAEATTGRAALLSLAFSSGVFVNILLVGGFVVAGGTLFLRVLPWLTKATALLLFVFGFGLLGFYHLPGLSGGNLKVRGKGISGALYMGLFSGVITGPCSLVYLVPLLLLAIKAAKTNPLFAAGLVIFFALGYAAVLMVAGIFSHQLSRWLQWGENSKGPAVLSKICGVVVIAAGFYFLFE